MTKKPTEFRDGEGQNHPEDPPPLFSRWSTWYWVVLGNLVLLIILFTLFTKTFE